MGRERERSVAGGGGGEGRKGVRREREGWIGNFLFLKVGPTSSKFISIRSQRVF